MRNTSRSFITLLVAAAFGAVPALTSDGGRPPPEIPGVPEALSPRVAAGRTIEVEGPPSVARDRDTTQNSIKSVEALMRSRQGPGSVYEKLRARWIAGRRTDLGLDEHARLAKARYDEFVLNRVSAPPVERVGVEPLTLVYPPGYDGNERPVDVRARRLTLHGADRRLVAYFLNYDKVDPARRSVVFQINGHFGRNPSRIGLGLQDRGGLAGAAVGKWAVRGLPLLTYDDHDVGESGGGKTGLPRTLENLRVMDRTLLTHFEEVHAVGLSGGAERLLHFLAFYECPLTSAYVAGYAVPQWTRLDRGWSTDSPFGSDEDTHDPSFAEHLEFVDLAAIGLHRGVRIAFAHNAFDGGKSKYGYFVEMRPRLARYPRAVETRGDDRDGDGMSDDDGRGGAGGLAHEYDVADYVRFLDEARRAPTPNGRR